MNIEDDDGKNERADELEQQQHNKKTTRLRHTATHFDYAAAAAVSDRFLLC
jgi:hypothetical protein